MARPLGKSWHTIAALAVALVVAASAALAVPAAADAPSRRPAAHVGASATGPAAAPGDVVTRTRLVGRSVRGRAIRAYYRGSPRAQRVLVVLGQMHGDEPAGRATATWIKNNVRPLAGTGIWVVPTMNPDGHARHTRQNARGVDLNRNWPTNGWRRTSRGRYYSGPRRASEPETRAMMRFLADVKPAYIASIHQPLRAVGRSSKAPAWQVRLARQLRLPRRWLGVGNPSGTVSPTLTGWYNRRYAGVAITIEYSPRPSKRYRTIVAGRGITRATRVR
ncbi:putative carboxypeptidase [Nocardioides sp. J9]|uniref:DUF2817 domain-containing protein n=1 Tax=Nocardioides sp. J9 TaxID=935844 RepID=UPI0011ADADCF|nr:M14 family zinc carboxypeptidase [Nocardioides sp. J9]TWH04737.1 putative carboxypeptidase [Nocardioides sp. J9]